MGVYNAQISAGSLMIPESRRLAELLLSHPTKDAWIEAIKQGNILQKKSPATARRQAKLIRSRLEILDESAWRMMVDGELEVATQMVLAGAIKHSRLLGDFMRDVMTSRLCRMEHDLSLNDWGVFIAECIQRDPKVETWRPTTRAKLLQVILRILAEAKYIESTRSRKLNPPLLHPDVVRYLKKHHEDAVLAAMELSS